MPGSDSEPDVLVDTSVAVPLVVVDHEHHAAATAALGDLRLGLSGHAAFETFSVLTRLPPPARRTPAVVAALLRASFPASRFLSTRASRRLLEDLVAAEIVGGSVYDALVGAAAAEHRVRLATRDRRALATYRALGVEVQVLSGR